MRPAEREILIRGEAAVRKQIGELCDAGARQLRSSGVPEGLIFSVLISAIENYRTEVYGRARQAGLKPANIGGSNA